ncbi:MAG: hypothetical protein KDE09_13535, partial [Anaerolineales bacterium]|nr:hypothetical protein [Anaerolineales bacterium]
MFSTRKSVVLLAVIALLLSALACSLPGGEEEPTEAPPTAVADVAPTDEPAPTEAPTEEPTAEPTAVPTEEPAPEPTDEPTPEPEPTAATGGAVSSGLEPGWRLYTNGNYVNDLAYADGDLWAATGGGVVVWDLADGAYVKLTTADGLIDNETATIEYCEMGGRFIAVGSSNGIAMLNLDTLDIDHWTDANTGMEDNDVEDILCLNDVGIMFVGYSFSGVDAYSFDEDEWVNFNRADGDLESDFVDEMLFVNGDSPTLWVSSGIGLTILSDDPIFYDEDSGLPDDSINAMATGADGFVYLGTFDGLIQGDGSGAWTLFNDDNVAEFPFGSIQGIVANEDGTLWIGSTFGEVCLFDPTTSACVEFYEREPGMADGLSTMIWADGVLAYGDDFGEGVSVYNGDRWASFYIDEQLGSNDVRDVAEDIDGFIWVATDSGVYRIDPADESAEWVLFDTDNSGLPSRSISTIFPDPNGGIWFGGFGIAYYDGSRWTPYDEDSGLISDFVRDIQMDNQGRLWVGTSDGISVWDGTEFTNFGEDSGLPETSIRVLQPVGDAMWVGTNGGGLLRIVGDEFEQWNRDNSSLPSDFVDSLAPDPSVEGGVLAGTGGYIVSVSPDGAFSELTDTDAFDIADIHVTPEGEILVASTTGAYVYADGSWRQLTVADGIPNATVTTVFVDSLGTAWFGAGGTGNG